MDRNHHQQRNVGALEENAIPITEARELTPEELERVIRERKAEKRRNAEEKRQADLRRIVEMKSRHGEHPIDKFPELIWCQIMESLSPQDRYNLCVVHPCFDSLMSERKIQDILLPMVLDFKACDLGWRLHLPTPFNSPSDLSQIRTLRLVSKCVRNAVDKWIEDYILQRMKNSSLPMIYSDHFMSLDINDANVANRISVFTSGSPISERPEKLFLRTLRILWFPNQDMGSCDEEKRQDLVREFNRFGDNISEFLRKVGDQIMYLAIKLPHYLLQRELGLSNFQIYNMLRQWFSQVPNLKWLLILARTDGLEWNGINLEDKPMPTLSALERVDVFDLEGVRLPRLLEAVLSANPQVKYFAPDKHLKHRVSPSILRLSLESLCLENRKMYGNPQLFQQIAHSNWTLKRMSLELDYSLNVVPLFEGLENIPTLEDLSLKLEHTTVGRGLKFLRLPNLKRFEVVFGSHVTFDADRHYFFFDLHFLLYCGKLESLTWTNRMSEVDLQNIRSELLRINPDRLINFLGECGGNWNPKSSKVWEIFPKLKLIKRLYSFTSRDCLYTYRP